jgi:hypothetical protein
MFMRPHYRKAWKSVVLDRVTMCQPLWAAPVDQWLAILQHNDAENVDFSALP